MVAVAARTAGLAGAMDLLAVYLGLGWLGRLVLPRLARRAHRRQGADPARLPERHGLASQARPPGDLVWVHAASVGEVNSVLAFAAALRARTGLAVLFTTTTEGGRLALLRRDPEALHQFAPLDLPEAVAGFLTHWRPSLAIFVEADIWPRMVLALQADGVPMVLLNARASGSRRRFAGLYRALLTRFALVTTQSEGVRQDIVALGVPPARVVHDGNLKAAVRLPEVEPDFGRALRGAIGGRGAWAAVSTHPGEEELVLDAHRRVGGGALLVLVPRHPERAAAVVVLAERQGLRVALRSRDGVPGPEADVLVVDSFGEALAVYAATGAALVGGSLVAGIGGHTPFEPAACGAAILSGPHVGNFVEAYDQLQAAGAAARVEDAAGLADAVARLLADGPARAAAQAAGAAFARAQADGMAVTLERVLALRAGAFSAPGGPACSSAD
jgi:3-deoxy-D-manno-octulosonic-acid transferase